MTRSRSKVWLLVGVMAGLVIAGTWMGYRWLRGAWAGLLVDTRQTFEAGAALGHSLTANACLDTAFARHAQFANASLGQHVIEGAFLEGCLRASTPTAICDSIPAAESVRGILRYQHWAVEQCRQRGLTDRTCPNLLQAVTRYCGQRANEKMPGVK